MNDIKSPSKLNLSNDGSLLSTQDYMQNYQEPQIIVSHNKGDEMESTEFRVLNIRAESRESFGKKPEPEKPPVPKPSRKESSKVQKTIYIDFKTNNQSAMSVSIYLLSLFCDRKTQICRRQAF